ncbi:hypothetical protein BV20DRAFT_965741, partial [Pilatotrama ljubarskyi]
MTLLGRVASLYMALSRSLQETQDVHRAVSHGHCAQHTGSLFDDAADPEDGCWDVPQSAPECDETINAGTLTGTRPRYDIKASAAAAVRSGLCICGLELLETFRPVYRPSSRCLASGTRMSHRFRGRRPWIDSTPEWGAVPSTVSGT